MLAAERERFGDIVIAQGVPNVPEACAAKLIASLRHFAATSARMSMHMDAGANDYNDDGGCTCGGGGRGGLGGGGHNHGESHLRHGLTHFMRAEDDTYVWLERVTAELLTRRIDFSGAPPTAGFVGSAPL